MFRMKSNALLLTIITSVSALAIGLLSLSYISYYSVETSARDSSPHDFGFVRKEAKDQFLQALDKEKIGYKVLEIPTLLVRVEATQIIEKYTFKDDITSIASTVVSDSSIEGQDMKPGEVLMTGYNSTLKSIMTLKDSGEVDFKTQNGIIKQQLAGLSEKTILPYYFSGGTSGIFVVDDTVFKELAKNQETNVQKARSGSSLYYGIILADHSQEIQAYQIYLDQKPEFPSFSQYDYEINQRTSMGFLMFIVGFLGLTFLITSGCILYFKQMDEGEEEKGGYTILRKLGFTQGDLLRGIQFKQLFNFGIPLVVGLCHSYFAVKSGWFFFGTEMLTPMIVVMLLYTVLYSIFGLLSYIDGDIRVTAPDGRSFGWDTELLNEIQSLTSTRISMSSFKAPHPEPQHPQLLSVDGGSILLVTDKSLKKLEALWGKSVDQRRFRGNFVVA
ncbi:hypothetical protein KC345_g11353, partial [Hortaea werneckii]